MKKMKLIRSLSVFLFALALGIGLQSCKKTEKTQEETKVDEIVYTINNDSESLTSSRVTYYNEPVMFSKKGTEKNPVGHTWYYVAEVESPHFLGDDLSATHVVISDDKAYVTYNRQGEEYAGGIEVIDLSNPAFPSIISQELYDGADVNAVAVDYNGNASQRKLWLALSSFKKGAIMRQVMLENGLLGADITDVNLSKSLSDETISASANGIVASSDYIYVTAGQSYGGTFQLSVNDLSVLANEEYTHAKYPVVNGLEAGRKQITLRTGENSQLLVYDIGTNRNPITYDITSIYHQNVEEPYKGKSTLHIDENGIVAYVASGLNGLKGYSITTGAELIHSPSNMLTNGNTNGIAKDEDYIYLANGADGLCIATIPSNGSGEIVPVQVWDLQESGASANLVQTDGDWIFVAKGGGGLKILRKIANGNYPVICDYDSQGIPECLEPNPDELCESLLSDLGITLPERQNALTNHPDYFANENREIVLSEPAQISVTFISEGAGFKNSFGYYFYHQDNPPTTAADLQSSMTVIFPNASAHGSGGALLPGDKIYQLGTFPAGTVIGYFMLANAWNGQEVTNGLYTHYTIPAFNQGEFQQHILMYDYNCSDVIMAFEDVKISGGDKDFNDLVFQMSIEPAGSVPTQDYNQIPPEGN